CGVAALRDLARPARHEVDKHVLAKTFRRRVERAAAVEPCHQRNELRESARSLQHERVDRDAVLRAADDLAERFLDRAPRRRVGELDLAVLEMGSRLTVRDDNDLAIAAMLTIEDPTGKHQAVLEVG